MVSKCREKRKEGRCL